MEDLTAWLGACAASAEAELTACNEVTARHGLTLTEADRKALGAARRRSLAETGRVEFGSGVLGRLVYAFCDSPYLSQREYAGVLEQLQTLFYRFKGDCREVLGDDELISAMRLVYDKVYRGDLDALAGVDPRDMITIGRTGSLSGTELEQEAPYEWDGEE